jgi:hypothetical protein
MPSQTLIVLAPLLLTTVAIVVTLWLFFLLKMEIARLDKSPVLTLPNREMEKTVQLLQARLDQFIDARLEEGISRPSSGLNLGKRTLVLRLARRGDSPDHIAATLHLPRREVELLLKIHALSLNPVPGAKTETIH